MRGYLRRHWKVSATLAMALALNACNTVRGAGEDLKSAADTVDEAI
jgi:predicted small secreted protein